MRTKRKSISVGEKVWIQVWSGLAWVEGRVVNKVLRSCLVETESHGALWTEEGAIRTMEEHAAMILAQ